MRKLKLFFACLLMAVLSIGQVWGTEAVYKQTIFSADNNEKGVQNYTSTWTNTTDGFIVTTVNANNNNNGWSGAIKIGTKTNASTGTITTNAAIDKAITKVTLTIDAIAYPDNVTSITLKTSSNGSSWTSAGTFTKEVGAKTVTLASPTADLYYQIEVICTGAAKNGCIQFSQIDFYAEEGGGGGSSNPTVSADPDEVENVAFAGVTNQTINLTYENITGYETEVSVHPNADGTGTLSPAWLTASVSDADDYATVTYSVAANESAARTAYIKVYTTDGDKEAETIIPVSQAEYVEPFDGLELTFPDYNDASVSSYTASWTATKSGQVWDIYGFNNNGNAWNVIKAGRKSASGNVAQPVDATIETQVTDHAVGDIVVTVDAVTAAQITSHKLYVADNSSYDGAIEIAGVPATIAEGEITYTVPIANRANDLYYKLEYATAGTASANGPLSISKITYAYASAAPQKQSTGLAYADELKNHLVKVGASYEAPELTNPNTLDGITYASNATDVVAVDASTGALTIKAAGKAVITASRAEDATYKAGSASYTIYVATEAGTAADPLTEASAKALIDLGCTLSAYVKGTVANVGDLNTTYGSITLTLTDGLKFFGMLNTGGVQFETNPFVVEDVVTAVGNLKKYNSTYELDTNCELVERIPAAVVLESISINGTATALEYTDGQHFDPAGLGVVGHYSDASTAPITEGIVWVFDPDPLTEGTESVSVTATAGGKTSAAFVVNDLTVGPAAPLSPWASVYTSNVTLSTEGGTSASDAKVKFYGEEGDGYDAIKAGTGSVQGAVVVNVPAGATALHLHAYGWKGEALTLSITAPAGVTVTPSSITLNSNNGITSNSPFTLTEGSTPQTDAYYALTLSGNTAAADLTFTATSGKRFVLFGVNQVGAVTLESISVSGTATALEYNDGDHFSPAGLGVTGHYSDASTAPITEGIVWAFDPDPLTEGTTSVSVTATASGKTSAAFVVDGLTVAGAAPLSPWASVYTSNVTLSTEGGTSASAAKVKFYGEEGDGYDAIKAGTGSAQGAVVVNVPAGATALHFHAYGWNSESVGLTVTAPTGVTVSPATEISINSNSGIASNSPFTLAEGSDPKTDAYYAVSLSGNTEATNISISATSDKRFVLFGVNQEGGVVPVLQSLAVSGDLENKTYEAGATINPAGLTVMGTYNVGDPVDVTDQVEEWLYDALQVGDETVTISAKIGTVTSPGVEISGLTVTDPTPTITASPSFWNFNSVEQGASVAAKAITVTLKNVAAATVAISGDGASAYSVDETALTASGTITITPSTAAIGNFNATVTISDNEGVATSATITLLMTVNAVETPVSTTSEWVVATADDLVDGKEVLITGVKSDVTYAVSTQANNNRTTAAGTLNEGVFTPGDHTMSFTLVAQGEGTYALRASNGNYLYAASSSANQLKTRDAIGEDGKAVWTISINGDNEASIVANCETTNWRNVMQFNQNGTSAPVVACYASASQSAIKLYVPKPVAPTTYNVTIANSIENGSVVSDKATAEENEEVTLTIAAEAGYELSTLTINGGANVADAVENGEYTFNMPAADVTVNATFSLIPTPPTPDYGSYQRTVANGNYGTICLPQAGTIEGATLYNIGSYENGMIYVDEAGTTLEAGKPYIFYATADQLNVTYTSGDQVAAGNANGLYGFYDLDNENAQFNIPVDNGNYILYQNQYWLVSGRAAYIANYRAYIKISAIQNAQPAPGIRRVAMQVNGQNTTTGVDNLNAGETPVRVIIDGQLFIIRGEKMYNANGQLVK